MTAKEGRQNFAKVYDTIIGRNKYDQNKRNYVLTKYGDGNYYSDCSSSGGAIYNHVGYTTSMLNTAGMYQATSLFERVNVSIVNGHIAASEFDKLRQGDALMYVGNDASRPLQIGHVEYIHTLGTSESSTKLCGHGSGTPSYKNMYDYNTQRQASKASNGKAKGLICVLRRIKDDGSEVSISEHYAVGTSGIGLMVTASALAIRSSAGVKSNNSTGKSYAKGEYIFPTNKVFVNGDAWFQTDKGWVSGKYLEGWIQELSDASQRWWYVKPGYDYESSAWLEYQGHWYYADKDGWMATDSYVKSKDKDLYYWVDNAGIWEEQWDTKTPDLIKYGLVE